MKHRLRAEAFVEFLNWNLSEKLRPTRSAHFELRDVPKSGWGKSRKPDRYDLVFDNMTPGIPEDVCADVWHSVGSVVFHSAHGNVFYTEERLEIDVPGKINLADDKVVVPQRFALRHLFGEGKSAVGLAYMSGERQMAYENGIWRFAD